MTMRMKATPLGSAVPMPAGQDPDVETDSDLDIALRHLNKAAHRLKSAGLQRGTSSEIPIHRIKR